MNINKLIVIIILGCMSNLKEVLADEFRERILLQTDKELYLAGEPIYLNIFTVDENAQISTLSKVAYIEIGSAESTPIQFMAAIKNGAGVCRIDIPQAMASGNYTLKAYTRYMRNGSQDCFFSKPVSIVNTLLESPADRLKVKPDSMIIESGNRNTAESPALNNAVTKSRTIKITTDKAQYENRDKVKLSLSDMPDDFSQIGISVSREEIISDSDPRKQEIKKSKAPLSDKWVAEYEGLIIQAKVYDKTQPDSLINDNINIVPSVAVPGEDLRFFVGEIKDSKVEFYTQHLINTKEIVLSVDARINDNINMELISPYGAVFGDSLRQLTIRKEAEAQLIERSIAVQTQPVFLTREIMADVPASPYHLKPSKSYILDEYVRFPTMKETIIEFVLGVNFSTRKGKTTISLRNRVYHQKNQSISLITLDGVPVYDHEAILNINPALVKRLDIYGQHFVFDNQLYDCMLCIQTKKGNIQGIQLPAHTQLIDFDAPSYCNDFFVPDYSDDSIKAARIPDYRTTLYSHLLTSGDSKEKSFDFFTSDLKGRFRINIQGVSKSGEIIEGTAVFEVK